MSEDDGDFTRLGRGFKPSLGTKYIVKASGGHGSTSVELKDKGQIVVAGADPRCNTPGNLYFMRDPDRELNIDLSGVMAIIAMGDDYPSIGDPSMQGLYIPKLFGKKALRDEPSFQRPVDYVKRLLSGGVMDANTAAYELLLKEHISEKTKALVPGRSGALFWEYKRDSSSPTGFALSKDAVTGELKKDEAGNYINARLPRTQLSWYPLESLFHKQDLVEIVLAKPDNPSRTITISRVEKR